jgi:hypothetical protein
LKNSITARWKKFAGRGIQVDPVAIEEAVVTDQEDVDVRSGQPAAMDIICCRLDAKRNPPFAVRYVVPLETKFV